MMRMRLQIGLLDMRGMRRLVNHFERKVNVVRNRLQRVLEHVTAL